MHFSGPLPLVRLVQSFDRAVLAIVDGDRTAGARHLEALGYAVDTDYLSGPEQKGGAQRHLTDGAGTPDCNRIGRLDIGLHRRLPAGGEDITEE